VHLTGSIAVSSLAALLLAAGCAREPQQAGAADELATVDVSAPIDAAASLAGDGVERRPAAVASVPGVAGVLPDGFPRDLPLPTPSSLVDFDTGPHGGVRLALDVQAAPAAALAAYEAKLRTAGFAPAGDGLWTRGARRVAVGVTPFSGAARLSVELVGAP